MGRAKVGYPADPSTTARQDHENPPEAAQRGACDQPRRFGLGELDRNVAVAQNVDRMPAASNAVGYAPDVSTEVRAWLKARHYTTEPQ